MSARNGAMRACLAAGVFASLLILCWPTLAANRQIVAGHVPQAAKLAQPVASLATTRRLDLAIGLPLRNREALTNFLQEIYRPGSPRFRQYLTPGQFAAQFSPSERDYADLIDFAKARGFKIVGTHSNRTLLDVEANIAEIEQAFHIHLRLYQHPSEARNFYAPDTEPSLELAVPVLSISGLDDFRVPHPVNLHRPFALDGLARKQAGAHESAKESETGSGATPYATGSGPRGNFLGDDFRRAYAAGLALNGDGQSIGLLEFDGYFPNDIAMYKALAGLPDVPLANVRLNGFNGSPGPNNIEVALDIEMAIAMAQGLSNVLVYEGANGNDILNRMATDNLARQLSSSWSFGQQIDPTRDQIFQQFAAQGQTFFQASGDLGAWAGGISPPFDNPMITVVGGTSLTTSNTDGSWAGETAWGGGGGGVSTVYSIPAWQQGISTSTNQASATMRNIPDVAAVADDQIWVIVNNGEQGVIGGTSAAAPLWAGLCALANERAAQSLQPSVGFLNPALYAIGRSAAYVSSFHDVTSGNNTNGTSPNRFFAVPGYDLCTGWGTPSAAGLIDALLSPAGALRVMPLNSMNFLGAVGGPFSSTVQHWSLTNASGRPVPWSAASSATWLEVSPAGGVQNSAAPVTLVIPVLTSATAELPAGIYNATVWFTNETEQRVEARQLTLEIASLPVLAPDTTLTRLRSFSGGDDGANPNGMVEGNDGTFYGTTRHAGGNDWGIIYKGGFSGGVSPLYAFGGRSDGASPFAALVGGNDGFFYGTTLQGGAFDNGTIFRVSHEGSFSNLFSLSVASGDLPYASLTVGGDGTLFGTGYQGGDFGRGTVFSFSTNGTQRTLRSFSNGNDGGHLAGGVIQAEDGFLYGTTFKGGVYGYGTVFRLGTNGLLTTLVSFDFTNGAFPIATLAQDVDGTLYGTTTQGGSAGYGTVFKIDASGQFSSLYSFNGAGDGREPGAALTLGADGNLYGTTVYGGAQDRGTVLRLSPAGLLTSMAQFDGLHGANPAAALTQGGDGKLYGTTLNGGVANRGAIFNLGFTGAVKITSQPVSQSVFAGSTVKLSVAVTGSYPFYFQWRESGTNLPDGFNRSGTGTRVMTITNVSLADAGMYSVLVTNALGWLTSSVATLQVTSSAPIFVFQPTNQTLAPGATAVFAVKVSGNLPLTYQWQQNGTSLQDGPNLFGSDTSTLTLMRVTEADNGSYSVVVSNALGYPTSDSAQLTVVPVSAPGTKLTTLSWFSGGADGGVPNELTQGTNGDFYGTTQTGGPFNYGTAFQTSTNGTFITQVSFTGTNGSSPRGALAEGTDGKFYGTTSNGGTNSSGTVFVLSPEGGLKSLYSFSDGADGSIPVAGLTLGDDGVLYGVATAGGVNRQGTAFRIAADGQLVPLHSFAGGNEGTMPDAALLEMTPGNFLGVSSRGGTNGFGNIFRLAPDGAVTPFYVFSGGMDGSAPAGGLVQGMDGNFYGVTRSNTIAGHAFYGTIFRLSPNGALGTLYALNFGDGHYPAAGLVEGSDGNFYGTTYAGGASDNGTVFRIAADGSFATLVSFDGFDTGAHPAAALLEAADGALYGTTSTGGPRGAGTIFRLSTISAPQLIYGPASQAPVAGSSVTLSAAAWGSPVLQWQWLFNSAPLTNGGNIFGVNSRILTLTNVGPANTGIYSVVASNSLNTVTSSSARVTIVFPPVIQSIQRNGANISVTWSSQPGQRYRLQYKPNLAAAIWLNLGSVLTASGSTLTATDPVGNNTQRFYRVVMFPQP
jgi:uncharacterized repeat protein (TIGR03803 family)